MNTQIIIADITALHCDATVNPQTGVCWAVGEWMERFTGRRERNF